MFGLKIFKNNFFSLQILKIYMHLIHESSKCTFLVFEPFKLILKCLETKMYVLRIKDSYVSLVQIYKLGL